MTQIVYVLGVIGRSGTTHLENLLNAHPDFQGGPDHGVPEDYLLANAHRLDAFVEGARTGWGILPHVDHEGLDDRLRRALWRGVEEDFLRHGDDGAARFHTARTPSVLGLGELSELTDSKAVVIVRDGRAVLESGMRSFGWPFEEHLQRLAQGYEIVRTEAARSTQIHVVRFEDLNSDRRGELTKIFEFLGVDPELYDWSVEPLVYGSSDDMARGLVWDGREVSDDFDPLNRWRHWAPTRHRRLNTVAGDGMRAFGYELVEVAPSTRAWDLLMTLVWPLRRAAGEIVRRVVPRELRGQLLWKRGQRYRERVASNE